MSLPGDIGSPTLRSWVVKRHARGWPEWLGGVALTAPLVVYVLLARASTETHNAWIGVAWVTLLLGEFLILALVAPLIGHRRRYVLWCLLPLWGWSIAWTFGTRLVRLTETGPSEPLRGDDELQPIA